MGTIDAYAGKEGDVVGESIRLPNPMQGEQPLASGTDIFDLQNAIYEARSVIRASSPSRLRT